MYLQFFIPWFNSHPMQNGAGACLSGAKGSAGQGRASGRRRSGGRLSPSKGDGGRGSNRPLGLLRSKRAEVRAEAQHAGRHRTARKRLARRNTIRGGTLNRQKTRLCAQKAQNEGRCRGPHFAAEALPKAGSLFARCGLFQRRGKRLPQAAGAKQGRIARHVPHGEREKGVGSVRRPSCRRLTGTDPGRAKAGGPGSPCKMGACLPRRARPAAPPLLFRHIHVHADPVVVDVFSGAEAHPQPLPLHLFVESFLKILGVADVMDTEVGVGLVRGNHLHAA